MALPAWTTTHIAPVWAGHDAPGDFPCACGTFFPSPRRSRRMGGLRSWQPSPPTKAPRARLRLPMTQPHLPVSKGSCEGSQPKANAHRGRRDPTNRPTAGIGKSHQPVGPSTRFTSLPSHNGTGILRVPCPLPYFLTRHPGTSQLRYSYLAAGPQRRHPTSGGGWKTHILMFDSHTLRNSPSPLHTFGIHPHMSSAPPCSP